MADFDEVLAKIQNQLDSLKKSLRYRTDEYRRAAMSGDTHLEEVHKPEKPQPAEQKNLQRLNRKIAS
jgi:hypothetical protein